MAVQMVLWLESLPDLVSVFKLCQVVIAGVDPISTFHHGFVRVCDLCEAAPVASLFTWNLEDNTTLQDIVVCPPLSKGHLQAICSRITRGN